jgi:two-component system response regulator ChvI
MGMLVKGRGTLHQNSASPEDGEFRSDRCPALPEETIQLIFVEDDDLYREAVEIELGREGFTVHPFRDGQAMLAAVAGGLHADMVVFDWGPENTLGINLLSQMRARGLRWPVVFLTNRNSPTHEKLALGRGAADFIDKARDISILVTRLRMIAKQSRTVQIPALEDILECGRLTLRPRKSRAYWDGIDVRLTMAEFKIVQLLVSNAGSFLTYRQVYDCMHRVDFVAGSGEDGYRTNVRSAVRRIRAKFKAHCTDFDEIRTYRSFGYCWTKSQNGGSGPGRRSRRIELLALPEAVVSDGCRTC